MLPARVAVEAAKEVSKAVSNDIAVFRTQFDVETGTGKKKRLTPVEAELHVNPVSILFAAAAGLAGALFATVAWHGVSVPNPLGPPVTVVKGMKDTGFGRNLNNAYLDYKSRRIARELLKLPRRCADARLGRQKFMRMLADPVTHGLDESAQVSILEQIKILDAFLAEECVDI